MRLQTLNAFISAHTKALLNGKAQPPKIQRTLKFLKTIRFFIWKLEVKTARRIKITNYPRKRKRKSSIWHLWIRKASKKRKEESDENSETFHVIMVL